MALMRVKQTVNNDLLAEHTPSSLTAVALSCVVKITLTLSLLCFGLSCKKFHMFEFCTRTYTYTDDCDVEESFIGFDFMSSFGWE